MGFINENNESYYENPSNEFGQYQFVPLKDIINNFIIMYTGEGKVISKGRRTEVQMHAKRAIQEFSYDVFKVYKSQEIELPPSLTIRLPQDYVNWTKISWVDSFGVEREISPTRVTSNPTSILQDSNYEYMYDGDGNLILANESATWQRYKNNGQTDVENLPELQSIDSFASQLKGRRFGLDPENANANGTFYIDELTGLIHFSSTLTGSIISLHYISDGMATDEEMVVHKFAEDALYKYIQYAIVSVTDGAQEYLVRRYKKQYVAAKRNAKIRLSALNPQAIKQVLRGGSKQLKH